MTAPRRFPHVIAVNAAIITIGVALLAGCTLAPSYKTPEAAVPDEWNAPVTADTADSEHLQKTWRLATPADTEERGHWWQRFNDAELNALAEQLETGSLSLQMAVARYDAARAAADAASSGFWPSIGIDASVLRKRDSVNKPPSGGGLGVNPYSDALVRAQASYELDLWGRVRNAARAADYRADAANSDLRSVRLSLQADLAQNYFQLRSLDTLIELLGNTTTAYERALRMTDDRYRGGVARASDLDQAQVQLANAQTQLADARLQRTQTQNAIAILIGVAPQQFSLSVRALENEAPLIPVELPSQLLERRPDIAGAERRVAAANADIGIARAAWFPTFSLSGLVGYENDSTGGWLNAPNRLWAAGPAAAFTLFDAGMRRAQSDIAWAAYRETVANYRLNVINAYREVEDNLAASTLLASARDTQRRAAQSAVRAQRQAEERYRGGISPYFEVVTAQDKALAAQQAELNIRVRQLNAAVLLVKALGGDWQVSDAAMTSADE
jgi:NodT family efflux transporter outer membrane factor (OMF) lipoprotein